MVSTDQPSLFRRAPGPNQAKGRSHETAMPTYELTFVLDPRLSDEETQALCDEYKQMIEAAGGRVEHRDDWGKRQLAYPIGKLEEGRYFLWHLSSDNGNPTREVEHRMRQKEEVLRFLTVRTEKLDFDAAAAESAEGGEEAKTAGAEPAREEAPAAASAEAPTATEAAAPTTAAAVTAPAPSETPEPEPAAQAAETAAPESPAPAEPPAPQTAPATENETAPTVPSETDSGAVEVAEAEEEAAVGEAPSAGDAASGEDETPSEEEAR